MPTVETVEQIRQLGIEYWETLNLKQVDNLLQKHLESDKISPFASLDNETIELLLGIEFILKKGEAENE